MAENFAKDVWVDKKRFEQAECQYYESLSKELRNSNAHKKCEAECHEDIEVDELTTMVKPKKGKSGTKNNTNPTPAVNSVNVQESEAVVEPPPVKPKKNKKKNKNQKNSLASNADGGSKPPANIPNINKTVDTQQSKNKRNSGSQAQKRGTSSNNHSTLVSEIAKAREHIKNSLEKMDGITTLNAAPGSSEIIERLALVEKENSDLRKLVENLKNLVLDSQSRIKALENQKQKAPPAKIETSKKADADDDDGVDLFASESDEESEEALRIREERLAAYAAKKSKKPALIAKSSLVLDVKPWDDETDLKVMESEIRKITADGLLWGASKFVPVAFGIKKISISCVVEDDKVSIDWLTEEIEKLEDYVQSVDVAAFNKI